MIEHLKRGKPDADRAEDDSKVRETGRGNAERTSRAAATPRCVTLEAFDKYSPALLPPVAIRD